jgi:hypothetical protein
LIDFSLVEIGKAIILGVGRRDGVSSDIVDGAFDCGGGFTEIQWTCGTDL